MDRRSMETAAASPLFIRDSAGMIGQLRGTLGRLEHAVGVLNEGIVWTDDQANIQWCNPAFVRMSAMTLLALIGKPVEQVLVLSRDGATLEAASHPLRRALAAESCGMAPLLETLEAERGGQKRQLEIYASCLRKPSGTSGLMVVRDTTERRLAEQWLEAETARAELVRAVAIAANQAEDPEDALLRTLELVSRFLGWPLGRALLVGDAWNPERDQLLWYEADAGGRLGRLCADAVCAQELKALAQAVMRTGEPLSARNGTAAPVLAGAAGLEAALAFPVKLLGETCAVLEFFGPAPAADEAGLVALIEQVASHLGRVFERQQSRLGLLRAKQELECRVEERTQELTHLNSALMGEIGRREKVQRALGDAMQRHRALLESVGDVVFALSSSGRIESLNSAFRLITGRDLQEAMSRRALEVIERPHRRAAVAAFRRALSGEPVPPFEVQLYRADGSLVLVECNLTLQAVAGQPASVTGIARDVTEKRRAQAALVIRDRAMAATSEGILITDPTQPGNPITFVNAGFERMTGYSASEAIGKGLELLAGADTTAAAKEKLFEAIAGCNPVTVEMRASTKDGHPFWTRLVLTPVLDDQDRPANFVAILSDISTQKEAERMKNELVSTVSHELRTPLTSLRGFAELMLEREYPREKQQRFVQIIHRESTRLSNLINDFLDVQRMEAGRQEYSFCKAPVAPLLTDAAALFKPTSPAHEFVVECEEGLPEVRADVDRLRQVTTNLVSNAIKFSPGGGPVTMSARLDPAHPGMVVVSVADRGIGIPSDAVGKLFQKFYRVDNTATRKIGGTGLGLSIVRQVIEAHGGRIWVESEFGAGSTFLFTLPVFAASPRPSAPGAQI